MNTSSAHPMVKRSDTVTAAQHRNPMSMGRSSKSASMARLVQLAITPALAFLFGAAGTGPAEADELVASPAFHYLDNRGANNVGILSGLRQDIGTFSATPNGGAGTTGIGIYDSNNDGVYAAPPDVTRTLFWSNDPTAPNFFSTAFNATPSTGPNSRWGQWNLQFSNAGASNTPLNILTPSINGAQVMPFVASVAVSVSGGLPTFTWKLPTGVPVDAVRINIKEVLEQNSGGTSLNIFSRTFPGGVNSFTVDPSDPGFLRALAPNTEYAIEIGLLDLRTENTDFSNANVLSRSRAYFNFVLPSDGSLPVVYLPTVTGTPASPVYNFSIADIRLGQQLFIDPLVATGYEYVIGAGDPNFQSVLLPTGIGDNFFDLWLWNSGNWFDTGIDLEGGKEYGFGVQGVDRFRILGIESSAGLDPTDVTAFITGLTFNVPDGAVGRFTGTMTPLTTNVPEPITLALLGVGLAGLGFSRRKQ